MVERSKTLVLVLILLVCSALPLAAQGPTGHLGGTVKGPDGAPLPGVTVTILDQKSGASRVVTTDKSGAFAADLPAGRYSVSAELEGFGAQRGNTDVQAGGTATMNFSLEQIQIKEEITVTARKREESVQDVPFSVAAPTEEVLRSRGADNIEGVAANVAGFTVQNLGPGQSQVAMRGVSSGQIVRDQPGVKEQVGIYLDESPISLGLFTPDVDLFDVQRVEVLRGPQGTLFGAGSESGTVRYITNQPELNTTSTVAELTGDTITDGSQGGAAKVAANAPLGSTGAMRIAAYYNKMGGWIDAVQPNFSVKKDVNSGTRKGARLSFLFQPNKNLTITPRFLYQEVNTDGFNRVDAYNILANPYTTTRPAIKLGPLQQFTQIGEPFSDKFFLGDLKISYKFGGDTELTSITSYNHRDILQVRDAGALTSSITGGSIGLPENVYTLNSPLRDATPDAEAISEELRLSGRTGKINWLGGFFYTHNKRDYGQDLPVTGFTALTGIPTQGLLAPTDDLFFSRLSYKLDQYALFGEVDWQVTQRLELTAGLRYYNFKEDRTQVFDGIFGNDNNGTSLVSQPGSVKSDGFAPRVMAHYTVSTDTRLNAQVSRGFRLGGINDPLNVPLCTPQDLVTFGGHKTWNDETLWNYEIGSKTAFAGGKGSINISAYYMDIKDLQATVTAGSCSSRLVFNVPKAVSPGVELELTATPNKNFDFALSISANDSTLKSTLTSTDASGNVSVVSGIKDGNRLPTVPKFQAIAAATFQGQLSSNWLGYITPTYQYVGSRYTQVSDQAEGFGTVNLYSFGPVGIGGPFTQSTFTFNPLLPSYQIVNLRIGILNDRWDLAIFGNNLGNERALLALDQERGTRARVGFLVNQPRTVGISARLKIK